MARRYRVCAVAFAGVALEVTVEGAASPPAYNALRWLGGQAEQDLPKLPDVKGRATHELVLGGRVYGGADRYALDRATGEGHVLAYKTLSKLFIGEAGLRLRTFVPFAAADTARVVVELGGTKRELPVGDPIKSPAGSHEALGALIASDAQQLRAIDFVADGQAGSLSRIARVTLASKTGATVELELSSSADDGRIYVRGPRGLGKVSGGADHLVHTIEQAIATPP